MGLSKFSCKATLHDSIYEEILYIVDIADNSSIISRGEGAEFKFNIIY